MDYCENGFYICMGSSQLPNLKWAFEKAGGHWQSYIIWVKNHFTLSRADYQHMYEPIMYGWNANNKEHYFVDMRNEENVWENLRGVSTKYKNNKTTIKFKGFKITINGKIKGKVEKRKEEVDIWRYNKPNINKEHPTMKPIPICARAINNSSIEGDVVLDLFGGSGSTLIACEQTNRKCYMMELDPRYIDVIITRWENLTGNKAKKII